MAYRQERLLNCRLSRTFRLLHSNEIPPVCYQWRIIPTKELLVPSFVDLDRCYTTRSSQKHQYNLQQTAPTAVPQPSSIVPATTVASHMPHVITVVHSGNSIQSHSEQHLTPDTHPFYDQLLQWDPEAIRPALQAIAESISEGHLQICPDGLYDPRQHQGAHAWVFSTQTGKSI
jgi:hypothetical protein